MVVTVQFPTTMLLVFISNFPSFGANRICGLLLDCLHFSLNLVALDGIEEVMSLVTRKPFSLLESAQSI